MDEPTVRAGVCEAEPQPAATLCWPGLTFSREKVATLAVPAFCWTSDGELWEFEDQSFWVTTPHRRDRRRVVDETLAPAEGWSHPAACYCPACRVTKR